MIIIKSQDGSISECKIITLDFTEGWSINGYSQIQGIRGRIGEYESEERAKEVMEGIQSHIELILYMKDNPEYECSNDYIFTMPKA